MPCQSKALIFKILDIENIDTSVISDISSTNSLKKKNSIKEFHLKKKPKRFYSDILIVGGSLGGISASIVCTKNNYTVNLIESSSWIGGQITSQGVSALDENYLVETTGSTKLYKSLRNSIREYYLNLGAKNTGARFSPYLDPGDCWVSRLAFEPKVGLQSIEKLLEVSIQKKKLAVYSRVQCLSLKINTNKIKKLLAVNLDTREFYEFHFKFILDATECGDILKLANLDYSFGAESVTDTGEKHASKIADPENVQDYTYPFVIEYCPGENHTIEKPPLYEEYLRSGKFSLLNYHMFENNEVESADKQTRTLLPFWEYRRLIAKKNFQAASKIFSKDLSMINWESNDAREANFVDVDLDIAEQRLAQAKCLSLGFLYWLQTSVSRDDGGFGYPEFKLRCDILDTEDGLSKYPYIRESRRLKTKKRILENHISKINNQFARASLFQDSLGIGFYPIDIHGKKEIEQNHHETRPFQIPASAFIQNKIKNILPSCKNIATTHITNGAYRLHPIEWAIGEAAAHMAMSSLKKHKCPYRICKNRRELAKIQLALIKNGAPIFWFDDIDSDHLAFTAAQFLATQKLIFVDNNTLSFKPDDFMKTTEINYSLKAISRLSIPDNIYKLFCKQFNEHLKTKIKIKRSDFVINLQKFIENNWLKTVY